MSTDYDCYNREERALCAHLFRILHKKLEENRSDSYLRHILNKCDFDEAARKRWESMSDNAEMLGKARIYCEVALLRDAREEKRFSVEKLQSLWRECPDRRDLWPTPQSMLSAKPDLVIAFPGLLLVFEAKFTLGNDEVQLRRTKDMVKLWKDLDLWHDLGTTEKGAVEAVLTLADKSRTPNLSWQTIRDVLVSTSYPQTDRSWQAVNSAVSYLGKPEIQDEIVRTTTYRLCGLEEVDKKRKEGGRVGYMNWRNTLDCDLEMRWEYVNKRRYKYVAGMGGNLQEANWIDVREFLDRCDKRRSRGT